jgi:hypothetical protein
MVRSELVCEVINDQDYWFKDMDHIKKEKSPAIHLLPDYDEYGIGYAESDRAIIYDRSHGRHLDARGAFLAQYTLVIDGQILGTWKRTVKKNAVAVEVKPFRPLKLAEEKAIGRALERYGDFLGLPLSPTFIAVEG